MLIGMTTLVQAATTAIRSRLAGWLLVGVVLLALASALVPAVPAYPAGLLVWLAAAALGGRLAGAQRWQVRAMFVLGLLGLLAGLAGGADGRYLIQALEANQLVIAMLMGVSFLRLVTATDLDRPEPLPRGPAALIRTLVGGHLIGAVINFSTVMIIGDRLSAERGHLTPLQGMVVARAFSTAAFWSPFFAAMGITLVSAPEARLGTLVLVGIPLALLGLAQTAWDISRHPEAASTDGYPMHAGALWLPLLLAILVIIGHRLWPHLSVLTLVTLLSLIFALGWVLARQGRTGLTRAVAHVQTGLPRMGGEVSLFLAAAVLAAGVAALLDSFGIQVTLTRFGAVEAFVVLLIMVALAIVGMHPVTTVALVGSLLAPVVDDHNLLAMVFLMSWSLGVALSPFSGIQLALKSRYGVGTRALARLNWRYALYILVLDFLALWLYNLWAG